MRSRASFVRAAVPLPASCKDKEANGAMAQAPRAEPRKPRRSKVRSPRNWFVDFVFMGCLLNTTRALCDLEQISAASSFRQNSCNVLSQSGSNSQIPASDPSRQLTWEIAPRFMAYSTEYRGKDAHSQCRRRGSRCRGVALCFSGG